MTPPPSNPTGWNPARRSFPTAVAKRILRRDPECMAGWDGCTGTSKEADHIVGHADAIAAGWDLEEIDAEDNGQGLCPSCHRTKTAQEQARGRDRADEQRPKNRPVEQHPGLIE